MSKLTSEKMVMDRQTKGTVLYVSPNTAPTLRNLYIGKDAFDSTDYPGEIEVTVTRLDDEE